MGGRCKHAVALALYAAQLSRTGMEFAGETDKKREGETPPPRDTPFRCGCSHDGTMRRKEREDGGDEENRGS